MHPHWPSYCAIIRSFQVLVENKLLPSFNWHFFCNAQYKLLFTVKYYEFGLKISEKHAKRAVTSFRGPYILDVPFKILFSWQHCFLTTVFSYPVLHFCYAVQIIWHLTESRIRNEFLNNYTLPRVNAMITCLYITNTWDSWPFKNLSDWNRS